MAIEMSAESCCPCGSGRLYGGCCGPFHRGAALPATPEQLMRSRYSAYLLLDEGYLRQSWHPSSRPESLELSSGLEWLGLTIIDAPMPQGNEGWVEFSARFSQGGRAGQMQERSRFLLEEGRWLYVDGQLHASAKPAKIGRNDPCPCGSGRKYKQCCGK